jgi:hypothetical protein
MSEPDDALVEKVARVIYPAAWWSYYSRHDLVVEAQQELARNMARAAIAAVREHDAARRMVTVPLDAVEMEELEVHRDLMAMLLDPLWQQGDTAFSARFCARVTELLAAAQEADDDSR